MKTFTSVLFLALLTASTSIVFGQRDTILVDLGTTASPLPYNNFSDGVAGSTPSLLNTDQESTGYGLEVVDAFNGVNTTGSQTPAPQLGFVSTATDDSFFGSVVPFNGATEPTGGILLSNLNADLIYDISIFAARRGVSDNREAKYVITGTTKDSVALNASNNDAELATLSMQPAADGTLRIDVSPGENNDNSSGFYYFGAFRLTYDEQQGPTIVSTPADTLLIDFGTNFSPFPWNNLEDARTGVLSDLIDEEGRLTGVSLTVIDSFNGVNTAGSQTPDPTIGFPGSATGDSFFGSTASFGGVIEPSGAVELAGLDPNLSHSIRIFASRTASDNREAKYVITGATVDSTFVNAASNASQVGVVDLFPSADGKIIVTASPGPNNDNSAGFYYLGAMTVSYDRSSTDLDSVLVDFGSATNLSPAPWNNISNPADGAVEDLINSTGFTTGYRLAIVDSFNNINTAGSTNPNPLLGIVPEASGDSFFGNTSVFGGQVQPTGAVELSGLDTDLEYSVSVFASRTASDNREAQYVLAGATTDTIYLDAASNSDNVAIGKLKPDANGNILLTASAGPNNTNGASFYYLGALVITYPQQGNSGPKELSLSDPTGGEFLQVGKTFPISWTSANLTSVVLDYSVDNGSSWIAIDTVAAISNQYTWTIPNTPTVNGRVRITSDTLVDQSASAFEISSDTTSCNIVVIGSSTAAGTGASAPDSAWVNRFANAIAGDNTRYTVTNLARGGYTTFHLLPTGSTLGNGVGIAVDTQRNISRALELEPYAIIVNLPSNDAARFFTVAAQLRNFRLIDSVGRSGGANVFITTTQPRNFTASGSLAAQREVRDSIFSRYGDFSIDFWNGLADSVGRILPDVDSGDGVHVNDRGHRLLAQRVLAKQLDTLSCDRVSSLIPEPTVRSIGTLDVLAYPNPTRSGEITLLIDHQTSDGPIKIEWYDPIGRLIESSILHQRGSTSISTTVQVPNSKQESSFTWCKLTALESGDTNTIKILSY